MAAAPAQKAVLDSTLDGFPTVAFSFEAEGLPAAPWRLVVLADDAESPFMHAVRLELNEDYSYVRALMDGRPSPLVETELEATITRVLIGSVARMMERSSDDRSADAIADEAADSIAAAAARASTTYLRRPLSAAVAIYRRQPERFDYAVASGVGLLKGR